MADSSLSIDENNPIFRLSLAEFKSEIHRRGYSVGEIERLKRLRRKLKNRTYKREVPTLMPTPD
jgi:hypothetical protein